MIDKYHTRYRSVCYRSSCPEVLCKKAVLRNFAKFTEKHLCQSRFFNKVVGQACNFIKKNSGTAIFLQRTPPMAATVVRRNTKHKKDENTRIKGKENLKKKLE